MVHFRFLVTVSNLVAWTSSQAFSGTSFASAPCTYLHSRYGKHSTAEPHPHSVFLISVSLRLIYPHENIIHALTSAAMPPRNCVLKGALWRTPPRKTAGCEPPAEIPPPAAPWLQFSEGTCTFFLLAAFPAAANAIYAVLRLLVPDLRCAHSGSPGTL